MRCLFCKQNSSNSKSVEHIIPESMGNKELMLPLGYICDKCNNFFARKVEKPFMDLDAVRLWRAHEYIYNKKGRSSIFDAYLNNKKIPISFVKENPLCFDVMSERGYKAILESEGSITISIPTFTNKTKIENNLIVSRLLAKIALEFWAYKLKDIPDSLDTIIDDRNYELIRNHARLGTSTNWPCSIRRVYGMEKTEIINGKEVQKIYECDFLFIKAEENENGVSAIIYFVLIIRGIEFVINLGEPEIDNYYEWLKQNNYVSPLLLKE